MERRVFYKAHITFEGGLTDSFSDDSLLKVMATCKHSVTVARVQDGVEPISVRLSVMVSIDDDELGPYEIEYLEGV